MTRISGWVLLMPLKGVKPSIIMLTAKGEEIDKVVGLKWVPTTISPSLLACMDS